MFTSMTGAWAQSVSFEHNDWRAQQYDYDFTTTSFRDMFVPTNVSHYYDCNSDWLKNGVTNYPGELPEGTDNYQLFLSRMNDNWMAASLFDWFTMTAVTPAYTQYTYTIHFKVKCTQQLVTNTIVRAALFDYHAASNAWLSRWTTPNRYNYFYTAQNNVTSQDQVLGDEICAARMVGTTEPYESTCDVSFTRKSNYGGTLTSLHHFGFSSSRSLGPKSSRCAHRTFLYACVTPHLDGYVKHVVYQPNAGTGSEYTNDILRSGRIQSNNFTRTGYTFANWNTKADGTGTTYNEGDVITVDESTKGQMTLYAQWAPNNYTVKFDKQGGTGGSDNVIATFEAAMPQIATPTRSGYGFYGYFSEPNGNGTRYYDIYGTSTHAWDVAEDNVTLYACWGTPVSYIDANGSLKYAGQYEPLTNGTTTLSRGWYLVTGTVTTNTLDCEGDVKIILADGAKLTATGSRLNPGIRVSASGASLTIYGQTEQTGELIATSGAGGPAGIGGGQQEEGHNITINGGIITAIGGNKASAIGGGYRGSSSNIVVNSSLVLYAGNTNPPTDFIAHTNGVDVSDRLSGKQYVIARKQEESITITFDMQGGTGGTEQITMNEFTEMPDIIIPKREGLFFTGYFSGENGTGTKYYTADGTSAHYLDFTTNTTLYAHWSAPVPYIGVDGETKYVGASEVTNTTTTLSSGWYIVNGEVTTGTITCEGYVNLILADGATLTATGGMETAGVCVSAAGASLTIYGQQNQTGQLIATGGDHAAGIGGGRNAEGHDITINGGIITATGGDYGAGIGGGNSAEGHDITINRGVVTVIGGVVAAGIGGGQKEEGHNITINGGEITVTGGTWGSAIGGGNWGSASNITINGGTITATGGLEASAIGGGRNGSFSDIFVNASLILKADGNATPSTEIEHTSAEDLASALSGKQYATLALPSVNVNKVPEQDVNYGTFYHKYADYTVPNEEATIYTASVEDVQGETCLVLHKLEGNVIPANTAVILRTDESSVIDLKPCADASGISVPANSLSGANLPMDAPANCYIMSYGQNGLGFYKYAVGKTLSAHKAYLVYQHPAGAQARALRMVFDKGEETGIEAPLPTSIEGEEVIYNLQGVRLNNLQKGINIVNGKKIIVK